jgi:hypothetical protein
MRFLLVSNLFGQPRIDRARKSMIVPLAVVPRGDSGHGASQAGSSDTDFRRKSQHLKGCFQNALSKPVSRACTFWAKFKPAYSERLALSMIAQA